MTLVKKILTGFLTIFMAACAGPKIKQRVVMPAKENSMKTVKKIAVIDFSGDHQREFSTKLESFLANIKVKNKPYFTVVDRNALDLIIKEQKMVSESGLFDEKDAVKLGRLSGVDTVVNGFVKWPSMETQSFHEERSVCVRTNSKGKCKEWGTTQVRCNRQVSKFNVTVKAISVEKGVVTFSKNYVGVGKNEYCSDSTGKGKKLPSSLSQEAINSAMLTMRRDLAPYIVVMTIELMNSDDSELKDNKSANKLFESGLEFADSKRMDRACQKFGAATAQYDKSPALYHNLGVCAEIEGNLEKALKLHSHADNLLEKPDKNISNSLIRVNKKITDKNAVESQMR
ncbi:MAG TPA: hypothetical protein ENJ08_02175 [Gammaproteobacteria bacterium]|nr:hypothetical protein [Gammaproteobacteria bacterium]